MPVVLTYDVDSSTIAPDDQTRISLAFQRLGWEHIGGSAFRYPRIEQGSHASEDWLNHVIPALMFFRALVEAKNVTLSRFTLEAHSSAGSGDSGADFDASKDIKMYEPKNQSSGKPLADAYLAKLSENRLRDWIGDVAKDVP